VHQLRQGHRRHPPIGLEQQVTGAIAKLADTEGFQAHSHRLDVLGLCAACQ
jgi:Fe2+ or Zn2+ uptake regulation protein